MNEKNLYYIKPIQKKILVSLQRRSNYIIRCTENGTGVGSTFIKNYREDVLFHLGNKAYAYLEQHLDAKDYTWRVSSTFSWAALERASMTRSTK